MPLPDAKNLILTGIPRSGTTLLSAIVDSLDDSFCLSEPDWQFSLGRRAPDRESYVAEILSDFDKVRRRLLAGNSIQDRRLPNGEAVTNYFERRFGEIREAFQYVEVTRPGLTPDFLLGMKHNAPYLCVLPDLAAQREIPILAILRNPVKTVQSWRSLNIPISQGKLPAGERFWPELVDIQTQHHTLLHQQVAIYSLICDRFWELKNQIEVLRYEDLVNENIDVGRMLGREQRKEIDIKADHSSRHDNPGEASQIAEAFIRVGGSWRNYYTECDLST